MTVYRFFVNIFHKVPLFRNYVKYYMRFLELKNELKDFDVFSINDVLKIEPDFYRQRLSEWQDKGYIKKIVRGYYIFSDVEIDERILFLIANEIYHPSYVSLEMAFSYYGFIPEGVYAVTSVSTRPTRSYQTQVGSFDYHHIKSDLMFGFRLDDRRGRRFKIAEPEKALLDYLYINPEVKSKNDFEEMRINKDAFREKTNLNKLLNYLTLFKNKEMEKRFDRFNKYMDNA